MHKLLVNNNAANPPVAVKKWMNQLKLSMESSNRIKKILIITLVLLTKQLGNKPRHKRRIYPNVAPDPHPLVTTSKSSRNVMTNTSHKQCVKRKKQLGC